MYCSLHCRRPVALQDGIYNEFARSVTELVNKVNNSSHTFRKQLQV